MYLVPVELRESPIDGKGVFAKENIPKGAIVWKFTQNHDLTMLASEYTNLQSSKKAALEKVGYLSPSSNRWVYPPENDPARFTNHSKDNNLSAVFDRNVSEEPYFIAKQDIKAGEELTNNYYEFDKITQKIKPSWT